ncbi:MAG: endolytic transglycosylase MltG [Syntrophobacterales bacterium]|nr:endolytic transglycosylase MltG [Syntrophobacterales bacterium]
MEMIKAFNERKFPIMIGLVATAMFLVATFLVCIRSPIDHNDVRVTVEIPKGASFAAAASILSDAGLIKNRTLFHLLARLKNAQHRVHAGEYELSTAMSPANILDKIMVGEVVEYTVSIPEGYDLRKIADRLAEDKLVKKDVFLKLAKDPEFLASLGITAGSLEGYLFPDTYAFTRKMGEKEIIRIMVRRFEEKVTPEMRKRAMSLGLTQNQLLTLASLIEKEAKLKSERALVSAVFHNRLQKGMKLQCDPTAVYGLADFEGPIKKSHLRRKSPYNTYVINGLPPGPIASPGIESVMAALYPAPVDYVYFVSRNDGSHQFSSDLRSHNRAVAKYITKKD